MQAEPDGDRQTLQRLRDDEASVDRALEESSREDAVCLKRFRGRRGRQP